MTRSLITTLARPWPLSTEERPNLSRAVGFLDWSVETENLVTACYTSTAFFAVLALLAWTFLTGVVGLVAIVTSLVAGGLTTNGPRLVLFLARARRATALGTAPALITRATLRMRLTPAPEAAARFAARTATGPLADSLSGHVRRAAGGPGTGLQSFAAEWSPWFPELERASALVESSGRTTASDRPDTLNRAREAVLDGAHDQMATFAASVRGPATALYAFGVLLPLSLASLLPALSAAGVPASLSLIVVTYDVVLPVLVVGASAWLLARRPVAFPPPTVERSHPEVSTERWHVAITTIGAGGGAWVLASALLPGWTAPLAAVGCGGGAGLIVAYQPMQSVRAEVSAVDDGLADALSLIGRRIERGESAERALAAVASDVPGPTGELLESAVRRQRRLGIGIDAAFTDENGALAAVPSDRARSAAALLALAAREGRPAGEAVAVMGDHLDALDDVEQETRRAVGQVTSTLTNTAAIFGPLVGGATVALSGALGSGGPLGGATAVGDIGLAVGGYVLVLAVVLTTLATGLTYGLDRSLVGYRVGLALLAATVTFLTAFVGAGLTV